MIQLGRNLKAKVSAEKALGVDPTVRLLLLGLLAAGCWLRCTCCTLYAAGCWLLLLVLSPFSSEHVVPLFGWLQHEKSLKRLEKAKAGIEKDKQG